MSRRCHPKSHQRSFFSLVLFDGIFIQRFHDGFNKWNILLEELWQVKIFAPFIRLLIEIDGPDAVLNVFYIWCNINYKIIRTHITEQSNKASFIEFYKLLRKPDPVG